MMVPHRSTERAAFLLRVWRTSGEQEWRVFLEDVHTGEKRGFRDVAALAAFLHEVYGTGTGTLTMDLQGYAEDTNER